MTQTTDETTARVRAGVATDEELETLVTPQALAAGVSCLDPAGARIRFQRWYEAVGAPLGVDREPARRWFTGRDSTEEFVGQLDDDQLGAFERDYERLQAAWLAGAGNEG